MKRRLMAFMLISVQLGFGTFGKGFKAVAEEPVGNTATVEIQVRDWNDNPVTDAVVEVRKDGEIEYSGVTASVGLIEFSLPYPQFVNVDEEEAEIIREFSLGIPYPNPTEGRLGVGLSLPAGAGDLRVEVYNVLGQRVYEETAGGLSPGRYQLKLALKGLGVGMYFLKVEDDIGDLAVRRFVNLGSSVGRVGLSIAQLDGGRSKPAAPGDVYEFLAYVGKEGAVAELPDGSTYKLKSGFAREIVTIRGDTTLVLRLENNPLAVLGTVYGVDGAPVQGIRVWIYDSSSEDTVEAVTGPDGGYKLYPVHPMQGASLSAEDPEGRYYKKDIETGYILLSENDVHIDIYLEPTGARPPEGGGEMPQGVITIELVSSSYKVAEPSETGGTFETGQQADIVLSWFGFNYSGGPLMFNHPAGIATDGERLILADTRNNRILIWSELPQGNEPPDIVLGQEDFYSNEPGIGPDKLNWPIGVATDGQHLLVADTYNNRVLIWNDFPTENGQPADLVLGAPDLYTRVTGPIPGPEDRTSAFWPWGLWTDGERLIVTCPGRAAVLIWKDFPTQNNQPADLILTEDVGFGTPRVVACDGEHLLVGDHNPKVEGAQGGVFVWKVFPTYDDQPPDGFFTDPVEHRLIVWGLELAFGKLLGLAHNGFAVWDHIPLADEDEPSLMVVPSGGTAVRGGDGADIAVAEGIIYISDTNGNRVLAFTWPPEAGQVPAFAVGAPDVETNTLEENYFFTNPVSCSDGQHLFVASDFDRKLYVWTHLPDESGAKPDIVYHLGFQPWDIALHGDFLAIAGEKTICIWEVDSLIKGEQPKATLGPTVGDVSFQWLRGVAIDDRYFYLADTDAGKIYVWEGIPEGDVGPDYTIELSAKRLSSDGEHLAAVGTAEPVIYLFRVDDIPEGGSPMVLRGEGDASFNLPEGAFLDGKRLYVADTVWNRVLIWDGIPESDLVPPSVVLGRESLDGEKDWPLATRDRLFWPGAIWFDGYYLWIGEFKFSNRLLRFSPSHVEAPQEAEVPIYPGSSSYDVPADLRASIGIPEQADLQGYLVEAGATEIADWYRENMVGWSLEQEGTRPAEGLTVHFQLYRLEEIGSTIIAVEGYEEATVLIVSTAPWSEMMGGGEEEEGGPPEEEEEGGPPEAETVTLFYDLPELGEGPITFHSIPMDWEDFSYIEPLGNLNPKGGHTFPSDHGGLTFADPDLYPPSYDLRAPADGIVVEILYRLQDWPPESGFTGKYDDYKVLIAHTKTFMSYLDHISELSPEILEEAGELQEGVNSVQIAVKEGDLLGWAGGRPKAQTGLDWGVYDKDVTHFIHPEKYRRTAHAAHFMEYCDEYLKAELLERLWEKPTVGPVWGKFDYDQPGRLVGNWFLEGISEADPLGEWDKHLAFVYYMYDPTQIRIAIGGTLPVEVSYEGYAVVGNAPDPANITVESGKVVYWLTTPPELGVEELPEATLLVQMLDEETIKVEAFQGHLSSPEFTANARLYTR